MKRSTMINSPTDVQESPSKYGEVGTQLVARCMFSPCEAEWSFAQGPGKSTHVTCGKCDKMFKVQHPRRDAAPKLDAPRQFV